MTRLEATFIQNHGMVPQPPLGKRACRRRAAGEALVELMASPEETNCRQLGTWMMYDDVGCPKSSV